MAGAPAPEDEDKVETPGVEVLAFNDCSSQGRVYNERYPASPPLHGCWEGVGPGDYFGRAMAEAYPDKTILLVPCALSGVDIDFFRKDVISSRRDEFTIPPDNHWDGAYEWMLGRLELAQDRGVMRGILFHQGESDTGQSIWLDKVEEIVEDLHEDLGISEDLPFLAGELVYGACCASHNAIINRLPDQVSNAHVISAEGLDAMDEAHFDLEGQRELGQRYAAKMLELLE
jgi:hypothetical protein